MVRRADLVIDDPMGLQVGGILVELPAVLEADAVHHQMVVEMLRIHVGSHQHLKVGELPPRQFQPNGMDLLG